MACNGKKKKGKRLFLGALLSIFLLCTQTAFAEEVTLPADTQKVNVKNSYLTGVVVDNKQANIQQIQISNSFLVFVKVKVYPVAVQEKK